MPAMIVRIFNVYAVEAASTAVSVDAGSSVDGITTGNNAANNDTTASPVATAVPVKAQPSRPNLLATRPPARATAAATATITEPLSPRSACAHQRKPTAS